MSRFYQRGEVALDKTESLYYPNTKNIPPFSHSLLEKLPLDSSIVQKHSTQKPFHSITPKSIQHHHSIIPDNHISISSNNNYTGTKEATRSTTKTPILFNKHTSHSSPSIYLPFLNANSESIPESQKSFKTKTISKGLENHVPAPSNSQLDPSSKGFVDIWPDLSLLSISQNNSKMSFTNSQDLENHQNTYSRNNLNFSIKRNSFKDVKPPVYNCNAQLPSGLLDDEGLFFQTKNSFQDKKVDITLFSDPHDISINDDVLNQPSNTRQPVIFKNNTHTLDSNNNDIPVIPENKYNLYQNQNRQSETLLNFSSDGKSFTFDNSSPLYNMKGSTSPISNKLINPSYKSFSVSPVSNIVFNITKELPPSYKTNNLENVGAYNFKNKSNTNSTWKPFKPDQKTQIQPDFKPQKMETVGNSNTRGSSNSQNNTNRYSNSSSDQSVYSSQNLSKHSSELSNKSETDSNKYINANLVDFEGEFLSVCRDQNGCRYLQKKLEENNSEQTLMIFNEIKHHFSSLMVDLFGNYFCQKFIECCTDNQRTEIVELVSKELADISLNMYGTRAVQKMVECLSNETQIECIAESLKNNVVLLARNLNGNHVIQKCITRFKPKYSQFIYDSVSKHCLEVATHRHGCCVFQRCIDQSTKPQKQQLVEQVIQNALVLVQNPFGNYVVQYVLDLKIEEYSTKLISQFMSYFFSLSTQKFSSNVMEKCIKMANPSIRRQLVAPIINTESLNLLMRDSYGNYVVQTMLDYTDSHQKEELVNTIRFLLPSVRQTPYGKRIFCKLQREGAMNDQIHPSVVRKDEPRRGGSQNMFSNVAQTTGFGFRSQFQSASNICSTDKNPHTAVYSKEYMVNPNVQPQLSKDSNLIQTSVNSGASTNNESTTGSYHNNINRHNENHNSIQNSSQSPYDYNYYQGYPDSGSASISDRDTSGKGISNHFPGHFQHQAKSQNSGDNSSLFCADQRGGHSGLKTMGYYNAYGDIGQNHSSASLCHSKDGGNLGIEKGKSDYTSSDLVGIGYPMGNVLRSPSTHLRIIDGDLHSNMFWKYNQIN
ncbi:hypothetical protein BB559_000234 [Furculomyces boomerangus]|uniref:PUM-HD domain-containing protein n=1 Tax=Furculomyces boomerangus TaxID=61424 RepID=A0A2T9Z5U6_9FUNG|nr:hypothetical protein BB559_000234 [Furculomyces boomerangus]